MCKVIERSKLTKINIFESLQNPLLFRKRLRIRNISFYLTENFKPTHILLCIVIRVSRLTKIMLKNRLKISENMGIQSYLFHRYQKIERNSCQDL